MFYNTEDIYNTVLVKVDNIEKQIRVTNELMNDIVKQNILLSKKIFDGLEKYECDVAPPQENNNNNKSVDTYYSTATLTLGENEMQNIIIHGPGTYNNRSLIKKLNRPEWDNDLKAWKIYDKVSVLVESIPSITYKKLVEYTIIED